ncbi:Hypothetical protein NTJ_09658 [Nesidiocoris tenuis]|uniref:Uncharacterized protein n=1 Tax=Nesidiocoris tenuis TaxID=355587 RepID=A0ABN7AXE0_9HEMI|nr:Hypothetical protein NTJ_09658 [Nesidiocoris tenuis]
MGSPLSTLKELRTHITEATENGLQNEGVNTSVALMKRLLVDAQDKIRGMAEDSVRTEEVTVSHFASQRPLPEVPARNKMQLTVAQTDKLSQSTLDGDAKDDAGSKCDRSSDSSSKDDNDHQLQPLNSHPDPPKSHSGPPVLPQPPPPSHVPLPNKRPTSLAKRREPSEPPPPPPDEIRIKRPPSPTAGPSHKSDFVAELEGISGNAGTRLRLENEKLKREVSELRKLVSASGVVNSSSDVDSTSSRVSQLEEELAQAKETISSKFLLHFTYLYSF